MQDAQTYTEIAEAVCMGMPAASGTISVVGNVAADQVEDIWLGMQYDDTLTLLWHEGRWQIVSKVVFCDLPDDPY